MENLKQPLTLGLVIVLILSLIGNVYFATKPAPDPDLEDCPEVEIIYEDVIVTETVTEYIEPIITPPTDVETLIFAEEIDDIDIIGDPHVMHSGNSNSWVHWMYDCLLIYQGTDTTTPLPRLAKSFEVSPDGKVWTFKLVENAVFDSGNAFTAKDVVYSFKRPFLIKAYNWPKLVNIGMTENSWKIIDDYTVQLTLERTVAKHLVYEALIRPQLGAIYDSEELPKHYIGDDYGQNYLITHTAGMSRYTYEKIELGSEIVMALNPDYWRYAQGIDPLPSIKTIIWLNVPETSVQRMMLEKGDIDVAGQLSKKDVYELMQIQGFNRKEWGYKNIRALWMNTLVPPFDDVRVRQALKWAIDYDGFVNDLYYGLAEKLQTISYSGMLGYMDWFPYERNITKAKELLADAGYPDGVKITYITVGASEGYKNLAIKVADDLKDAGFDVTLELVSRPEHSAAINSQENQLFGSIWGYGPDPDSPITNTLYCTGQDQEVHNYAWRMGFFRQDVCDMIIEARETLDIDKRRELYEELQRIQAIEGIMAMIAKCPGNFMYRDWVENFNPHFFWYFEPDDIYKGWEPPEITYPD